MYSVTVTLILFCILSNINWLCVHVFIMFMYGWMNQAYSQLSTTHGHITDCKL